MYLIIYADMFHFCIILSLYKFKYRPRKLISMFEVNIYYVAAEVWRGKKKEEENAVNKQLFSSISNNQINFQFMIFNTFDKYSHEIHIE